MATSRVRPPTRTGSSRATSRPSSTRPGTSASTHAATRSTTAADERVEWIIAVLESKGVGREVGLAALNIEYGQVILAQYGDTSSYIKTVQLCNLHNPSQIIVPQSALVNDSSVLKPHQSAHVNFPSDTSADTHAQLQSVAGLVQTLREQIHPEVIHGSVRREWDEQTGKSSYDLSRPCYEYLARLMIQDDRRTGTILAFRPKYYALAAASALFKHVERSLDLRPRSLCVKFQPALGSCLIDTDTVKYLELVSNLLNQKSQQHLFGLINHCYTPMGSRLLRSLILAPPNDTKIIELRLNVVEELSNSEQRLSAIRKALEPLKSLDCDKLVGQIIKPKSKSGTAVSKRVPTANAFDPAREAEIKIGRLLSLRTLLTSLPPLRSALHGSDSRLLKDMSKSLCESKVEIMLETIGDTLNEDAVSVKQKTAVLGRNRRIYAVKAERKLLLDVARETYKEGVADAFQLCGSGKGSQYVFSCSKQELEEREDGLPKTFINVTRRNKNIEFFSPDLMKQNARINESVEEIFILRQVPVPSIHDANFDEQLEVALTSIRRDIACLFRCSEAIAWLDLMSCFAILSVRDNYVRPEWTDTLAIKAGRHPLQERFQHADGTFVPNDTYANEAASFQIVTGANMAGKSTYLRQIALLQIMAQIGCFVPAEYASFRCVDTLLTRLGNDDSIEASLSTFAQEMSTMAMIIGALETSEKSLIIVDELGRGTSPEDGVGIAHALAEEIVKAKAYCFFATHFKELCTTLSRYPNVVSLHLASDIRPGSINEMKIEFHHRVMDGVTPMAHYGLDLANIAALPTDVLVRARTVSSKLSQLANEARLQAQETQQASQRRELLRLRVALKDVYEAPASASNGTELVAKLRALQKGIIEVLANTLLHVKAEPVTDGEIYFDVSDVTLRINELSVTIQARPPFAQPILLHKHEQLTTILPLLSIAAEIDRTLKKVAEGVEIFESIFDKIQTSSNQTQKEKLEQDLKSQIKKLQRLRDQIKTWAASSDIKDKQPLIDNRKLIEVQMEKFKACEKEMKTKAFSKEGLSAAAKLDPKEKAKVELCEWLSNMVDELGRQNEQAEAEIEQLQLGKKKKDSEKEARLEELERWNERRAWHINRLELILRLLENGNLTTDSVTDIKDDIAYFVESNMEEDFEEDEGIYDELNLEDEEDLYPVGADDHHSTTNDSASVADEPAPLPPVQPPKTPAKETKASTASTSSATTTTSTTTTTATAEAEKSPAKAKTVPARKATLESSKPSPAPPAAAPTPVARIVSNPQPAPRAVPTQLPPIRYAAAAAGANSQNVTPSSTAVSVPASSSSVTSPTATSAPALPSSAAPPPGLGQQPTSTVSDAATASSTTADSKSGSSEAPSHPSSVAPSPHISANVAPGLGAAAAASPALSSASVAPSSLSGPTAPSASAQSPAVSSASLAQPAEGNTNEAISAAGVTPSLQAQSQSQRTEPRLPSSLADLVTSFESAKQKSITRETDLSGIHQTLEAGFANMPQPLDAEKPKYYVPRQPFATPAYYPQEPSPQLANPALFAKFDVDTLFYIFYYCPGTYLQYLAASELKKQSWRFHKQYLTWFQRANEPQQITDEYEQGVYLYFDWEGSWCQRRKNDFKFSYKFLDSD
ncbi:MutS protein msh4 [Microbotryomycetes sp. JL221]|nr:MutS protein msh4 [Microbotryomycetes sp. JL221]